ncbi:hypothetical protein D3C75_1133140 [compost metagenome]
MGKGKIQGQEPAHGMTRQIRAVQPQPVHNLKQPLPGILSAFYRPGRLASSEVPHHIHRIYTTLLQPMFDVGIPHGTAHGHAMQQQ